MLYDHGRINKGAAESNGLFEFCFSCEDNEDDDDDDDNDDDDDDVIASIKSTIIIR